MCDTSRADPEPANLDLILAGGFNGAEPISADTIERFVFTFSPFDFRPSAMYPRYGLAEATLFVAASVKGRGRRTMHVDDDGRTRGRLATRPAPDRTQSSGRACPPPMVSFE